MFLKFRDLPSLLKKTAVVWYNKDPFRESSVIAYYAIFSIPALLVIVIAVVSLVLSRELISGYLYDQIGAALGQATALQVRQMVLSASSSGTSVLATIFGVLVLLMGATGVFAQLQKSLNLIWDVVPDPKKENILTTIKTRLFSFGLILSIGFLMLVSFMVTSLLTATSGYLERHLPAFILSMFFLIDFFMSLVIISLLFALIFKVLPDVKLKWSSVWVGSVLTSVLFMLGKTALGYYFGAAEPGSVYGAAGSVILILLWVSYSSMILFFGAEFIKIYTLEYQEKPMPTKIHKKNLKAKLS